MSLQSDSRRKLILLGLALMALLLQSVLDNTRINARQRDYDLKLEAATIAADAYAAVRRHRRLENAEADLVNDPAHTGLIGPEFSLITNAQGVLESKLTTLNPNWAGVMVQYFKQIGLTPGDLVGVALSGSFPGMNICVFAAIEAMGLEPAVTTSVGASHWGANDPAFTWLDMENVFYKEEIFSFKSEAASHGGGDDMGRGLSREGRDLILAAIGRSGADTLISDNIEDAIAKRMAFYEKKAAGRRYKAFVNVGGGLASLGSSQSKLLIPEGLFFELEEAVNFPRKGAMILMAERGVPCIHLLGMQGLAMEMGLPVAPDYLPEPGEGEIFIRETYRLPLAIVFLVLYCAACALVLAPELRRGLFDRWSGRVDGDTV